MSGPIVIVGAGLAGLRAAEALRNEGYHGQLTVIGDERYEPYDRPPLSKQVLTGWVQSDHTTLPRLADLGSVNWELGVRAVHLDLAGHKVVLADGREAPYDRCLFATGLRARPWPNEVSRSSGQTSGAHAQRNSWPACSSARASGNIGWKWPRPDVVVNKTLMAGRRAYPRCGL